MDFSLRLSECEGVALNFDEKMISYSVAYGTGCALFTNTYRPPDPPFVAAMLAAPLPITTENS